MRPISTGRIGYKNGRWLPDEELSISWTDSQFMFGDGCFEMHRTFAHRHFLLDEHIDRLFSSMRSFSIPINKTRNELRDIIHDVMVRNESHYRDDEYRFMINVSRGPLPVYREVFELDEGEEWGQPTWIINAWPLSKTAKTMAHFYETGANAVIVPQRQISSQYLDPKVKSRSRAHLMLANIQANHYGKDAQALLLDEQGLVAEGTGANFVIIKDRKIIVPELRNVLRGCSMTYIIDVIAPVLGLEVIECNFEPYDVLNADEAFFTGTFTNLIPCNRLNGQMIKGRIGSEPMGQWTKRICEQWSENVGVDFIAQVKEWSKR